ncbi:MAG TPA: hypothetical protein VKW04_02470 [Planctomycetota bacterium]|nr:hypothetical protein [Planctomycetota bacterium]
MMLAVLLTALFIHVPARTLYPARLANRGSPESVLDQMVPRYPTEPPPPATFLVETPLKSKSTFAIVEASYSVAEDGSDSRVWIYIIDESDGIIEARGEYPGMSSTVEMLIPRAGNKAVLAFSSTRSVIPAAVRLCIANAVRTEVRLTLTSGLNSILRINNYPPGAHWFGTLRMDIGVNQGRLLTTAVSSVGPLGSEGWLFETSGILKRSVEFGDDGSISIPNVGWAPTDIIVENGEGTACRVSIAGGQDRVIDFGCR